MNSLVGYIILFTIFLGGRTSLPAQEKKDEGIYFLDNVAWKEVVEKAKTQNRKIFVDCYTSWCGPCKLLAGEVLSKKKVGDFFNATFVNVKYDMEKEEGLAFGKEYKGVVQNYPTMLVIDPVSGKILHKFVGRRTPDEIILEAKRGLMDRGISSLRKRYEAGERDYEFIKDYVLALQLSSEREELVEVIDRYFTEDASFDELLKDREKWAFFSQFLYDVRSELVQFAIHNNARLLLFINLLKARELRERLGQNIYMGVEELLKMKFQDGELVPFKQNEEFYEMLVKNVKDLTVFDKRESCVALLHLYDRLVKKEWEAAFELLSYIRVFEMERAVRGNYVNVCLYIAKNSKNKKLIHSILVDLQSFQAEYEKKLPNFNQYLCIAFVQQLLGDKKGAVDSMEKYHEFNSRIQRGSVSDFIKSNQK